MRSAAFCRVVLGALILVGISISRAASDPSAESTNAEKSPAIRLPPLRPGATGAATSAPPAANAPGAPRVSLRQGKVDYVSATDLAVWLGLKGSWTEPLRKLALTDKLDPKNQLELEANRRSASVHGLRVELGDPTLLRSGQLYVSRTDAERGLAPLVRPAAVAGLPARPKIIALDAGHGGEDPGMENKKLGLKEKVLALDVTLRLEKLLKAAGYTVVLTRRDDRQLAPTKAADWQQRALIANAARADLLVSLHFNSLYPDTRVSGTEVYVFTRAGQRSDQSWGFAQADDSERDASPVNQHDAWSSLLAHELHRATVAGLNTTDRGQKTKHLAVLRGLNCPAVLIESLFLSNEAEARRAATPEFRQRIAEVLATGIRGYAATLEAARAKSAPAAAAK